eukprot:12315-Heterococcus_DN1.PRE.1
MIAEVPTMAIDLVTISENQSALQDEFLAHRLGLIPLRVESGTKFEYNYDCDCEDYCEKCSVILTLDATWEGKAADRHGYDKDRTIFITSLDLVSSDPRVTPVHFSQGGQKINLQAIAKKGIAKEHAKWSPVCVATYQFDPIIHINEEACALLTEQQKKEIVDSCPTKVYELDARQHLRAARPTDCMYCDECVVQANNILIMKDTPEDDPAVTVNASTD